MAEVKIKIGTKFDPAGTNQARKAGDDLKNTFDGVAADFQKKLIGNAALATAAFKLLHGAMNLVRPSLEGLSHAGGRVGEALQAIVTKSGAVQGATAGLRVGLETIAELLEARVVPGLFQMAGRVAEAGQKFGSAAVMSDRFKTSQKSAADAAAAVNEALGEQMEKIDDLQKRQGEQARHALALHKARINADPRLTSDQKIAALAQAERANAHREAALQQKAASEKIAAADAALAAQDQIIRDAQRSIPDRGRLTADVRQAQAAAAAEEAAQRKNRETFALGEGLRDTRRSRFGHEFDLAAPGLHRERLTPEEQRVYDFIQSSGGLEAARAAHAREKQTSRAELERARAARQNAFAVLPGGVATPEQAEAYAREREGLARDTISRAQAAQEKIGGQRSRFSQDFADVGRSFRTTQQTDAIEDNNAQIESLTKLSDTLNSEKQNAWGEVVAALKEGKQLQAAAAQETLRAIRESNAETQRQIAQLQARGPQ